MTLTPGTRFGGYEILALIGSGTGKVYRARDTHLGRDVAIRVLPPGFASPERLLRFEQEARSAAALNHPNILAVYDISEHDGAPYIVAELLEGESLRTRMTGPMPLRKVIPLGLRIASALAAAHDNGIIHRDLKPENVFVMRDGRVKLLDFGLARLTEDRLPSQWATASPATAPAARLETGAGVLLGTVGYLSPEQIRGVAVDQRSDLFSFGAVLYEMLAGRRAFTGESPVEVTNAILTGEAPPFTPGLVPAALDRLVRHCLEKQPAARFQSAHDLAFALDTIGSSSATPSSPGILVMPRRRRRHHLSWWRLSPAAAVVVCAVAVLAGIGINRFWASSRGSADAPLFRRLTSERGLLRNARFSDEGGAVVFSAAWDGPPLRLYMTRASASASTRLELPPAHLFSISRTGELAISLGHAFDGWLGSGTLARAPLVGGGARPLLDNVREAEWTPDGTALAIVRRVNGRDQLEWPIGHVQYATSGYLSTPRFSSDGRMLAFGDHPIYGEDDGDIDVIDAGGTRTVAAAGLTGLRGLAWSATDDEIWFTALANQSESLTTLQAVTVSGRRRTILTGAVDLALMDIDRTGRVLLSGETRWRHIEAMLPGDSGMRDFSRFDGSVARTIADGGRQLLITRQGPTAVYLRSTDQDAPMQLGEGDGYDLSRDGRWALAVIGGPPSRVLLLPTGAGERRELPNPRGITVVAARFLPDSQRLVIIGGSRRESWRAFVQDVRTGLITPFSSPGISYLPSRTVAVTGDGRQVALLDGEGHVRLFPVEGGEPLPIPGLADGEYPLAFTPDDRFVFVTRGTSAPWRIDRIERATGNRELWKEISASQNAGVRLSGVAMSSDGQAFVHSYSRLLSNLFIVEGIR